MEYKRILNEIEGIKKAIDINFNSDNPYLMGGAAGVLLFYHEYFKLTNNSFNSKTFESIFNNSIEHSFSNPQNYSFSHGLSGLGWLIEFFIKEGRMQKNASKIFKQCDEYLLEIFKREIQKGNYDFLHGAMGICLYFIAKEKIDKKVYQFFFDNIEQVSKIYQTQRIWETFDLESQSLKLNNFNLGLSHGIPSILVILCQISDILEGSRSKRLLLEVSETLLRCKNKILPKSSENFVSLFPYETNNFEPSFTSRLAWCYGDLGVAIALWEAGVSLSNSMLKNEALSIAMHCTQRRKLNENGIEDSSICHGTAGIAHIFNKFYIETNNLHFKQCSQYWINETLKKSKLEKNLNIYETSTLMDKSTQSGFGLLEGMAGVGLVLINSLINKKQNWDNCLLLF